MADNETYHGTGFTGRRLGEPSPQEVLESHSAPQTAPNTPAHHQGNVNRAAPPEMHCLSCNSQAQWLPNGQLWCPQCQTTLEARASQGNNVAPAVVGVIGAILGLLWLLGAFDAFLLVTTDSNLNLYQCNYYPVGEEDITWARCMGPLGNSYGESPFEP